MSSLTANELTTVPVTDYRLTVHRFHLQIFFMSVLSLPFFLFRQNPNLSFLYPVFHKLLRDPYRRIHKSIFKCMTFNIRRLVFVDKNVCVFLM